MMKRFKGESIDSMALRIEIFAAAAATAGGHLCTKVAQRAFSSNDNRLAIAGSWDPHVSLVYHAVCTL